MTVDQESAYTSEMGWKDYLTSDERDELEAVEGKKSEAVGRYNAVWKRLKSRCDARMRRDRSKEDEQRARRKPAPDTEGGE